MFSPLPDTLPIAIRRGVLSFEGMHWPQGACGAAAAHGVRLSCGCFFAGSSVRVCPCGRRCYDGFSGCGVSVCRDVLASGVVSRGSLSGFSRGDLRKRGMLWCSTAFLSRRKIRYAALFPTPLQRVFGVVSLRLMTSGGKITVPMLNRSEALRLAALLRISLVSDAGR